MADLDVLEKSEEEAKDDECGNVRFLHSQTLANHGQRILMLEQRTKNDNATWGRIERKIDMVEKGVGDLAQSYGTVVMKVSSLDESVASITNIHKSLSDKTLEIERMLNDRDGSLPNISDDDSLDDIPTGVISRLSGKDVKLFVSNERKERLSLQAKVEDLLKEKLIHDRELAAVESAKAKWQQEHDKMVEENHKTKIARYGLYSGIIIALITAGATILTSLR